LALIVGINISLGGSSPLPARDRSFISHAASDIVGSAFFHLDYQVPMAELRTAFQSILAKSASWDGRVDALQVTDTTEHTIEVRAIMTAPNAPAAFDLRCEVRERLIAWLQDHHPEALPRLRTEVGSPAGAALKSGDHSRGLVFIGGGQRMLLISPAFADGEPIPLCIRATWRMCPRSCTGGVCPRALSRSVSPARILMPRGAPSPIGCRGI
jgi:hypothetical protein